MNSPKHIASPGWAMSRSWTAVCLSLALACTGEVAGATNKHPSAEHHKGSHRKEVHHKTTAVARSTETVSASEATAASTERLVAEFAPFVGGSRGDAESLVTTLRSGRATSDTGPASQAPATGPLGYGEVRLALKLAQGALKQHGITAPNPDQLSAALHGGNVGTAQGEYALPGVLPQRHQGAGWATMAQDYGLSPEDMVPPPHTVAHKPAKAQAHGKAAKGSKAGKRAKASKSGGKSGSKALAKKKHG